MNEKLSIAIELKGAKKAQRQLESLARVAELLEERLKRIGVLGDFDAITISTSTEDGAK